jgi:RNA polymerase sigma factor (sigma-70 family)
VVVLPPLEQLYRSHGAAVLRRARALLGEEADAQEVLHDVFASLLERPDQFRGDSSIMTFLYRMTTHLALGRMRSRRTRLRLLRDNRDPGSAVTGQPQEAYVELRQLIVGLPEELARVAAYYYLDEMSQDEIASLLGCSRQWIGKLIQRLKAHAEVGP